MLTHICSHISAHTYLHATPSPQAVEVVLTAHPTQVNRRTLQYKHQRIAALLQQNDRCVCLCVCVCVREQP